MRVKTEDELVKLVIDITTGKIFTLFHLPRKKLHLLPKVFLPLSVPSDEFSVYFKEKEIVFFYEYMELAAKVSINGYPVFTSFNTLNKDDTEALIKMLAAVGMEISEKCISEYIQKAIADKKWVQE